MECSQPPVLTDDQIFAALDNEADPAVVAHLAACPACTARFSAVQALEQQLKSELYRHDCPSAHELADYQDGTLSSAAAVAIAAHIARCPLCSAELEALDLFLADEAPSAQVHQLRSLSSMLRPLSRRPRLAPILASIVPSAPATVLRGGGGAPIMAKAGETTIWLQPAAGAEGQVVLTGELYAAHPERQRAMLVEVRQGGSVSCVVPLDSSGAFQCILPTGEPAQLSFVTEDEPDIVVRDFVLFSDRD